MAVFERPYLQRGEPFVWFTAAALAFVCLIMVGFLVVIAWHGMGFYWPGQVRALTMHNGQIVLGEVVEHARAEDGTERLRVKVGNRDLTGSDFRWVDVAEIIADETPAAAVVLERREHGHFYGLLPGEDARAAWRDLRARRDAAAPLRERAAAAARDLAAVSRQAETLRDRGRSALDAAAAGDTEPLAATERAVAVQQAELEAAERDAGEATVELLLADGSTHTLRLLDIVRAWPANQMSSAQRAALYAERAFELLTGEPRESNTEGGLFPAIFGTVMMVFLMSIVAIPFGVVAAVYLREYARDGPFLRLVRISVNNLAGVPSIVYGVFGLGFFVYGVGGAIDQLFFAWRLPAPTFGTGGILWASLTLSLLTVPVVIVSTEEALAAIPKDIREGSLALGATRFQTLTRILLPMSTPGILTGLILAMARAAGEVAPLMLTGAVKLAPELPFDAAFPYLHLDRKFMHLGFHIYDLAFQSPNVEAVLPMVYVTTMLLLGIVIALSAAAIVLRNRMRRRYATGAF